MKRQISMTMDKDDVKNMEQIRDKTGISINGQMNLKLKGYKIVKM